MNPNSSYSALRLSAPIAKQLGYLQETKFWTYMKIETTLFLRYFYSPYRLNEVWHTHIFKWIKIYNIAILSAIICTVEMLRHHLIVAISVHLLETLGTHSGLTLLIFMDYQFCDLTSKNLWTNLNIETKCIKTKVTSTKLPASSIFSTCHEPVALVQD